VGGGGEIAHMGLVDYLKVFLACSLHNSWLSVGYLINYLYLSGHYLMVISLEIIAFIVVSFDLL
jgi:hypothetical protein